MIVCNFTVTTITELKSNLTEGKSPPASIAELANAFVSAAAGSKESLTIEYIQQFLLDFVAEKASSMAIIDLNDELKLYKAKQNEILRPQTAVRYAKTFTDGFAGAKDTSVCESGFERMKTQGADIGETDKLLGTFRTQWSGASETQRIELPRDKPLAVPPVSKDKRIKALEEIFRFYTKQSSLATSKKTFETVQAEASIMNLGYFLKFAKDFSVPVDVKRAKEMFTKVADAGRSLPFQGFVVFLI